MKVIAGHCGKCGAPYFYGSGPWGSILPQPPMPLCACWNIPKTNVRTTDSITPSKEFLERTWKKDAPNFKFEGCVEAFCEVSADAGLLLRPQHNTIELDGKEALALAHWILDTFEKEE